MYIWREGMIYMIVSATNECFFFLKWQPYFLEMEVLGYNNHHHHYGCVSVDCVFFFKAK